MLPSSFRVSLTVLAVCAVAVSASPDLTVGASGETLKLPNDPRGVLDPSSGNTLTIVDTGVAGPADPSALTALLPGDSVNVTHHCKRIVSITFDHLTKPPNLFTNIDADGTREDLYATAEGIAKINLPGDLAVSRSLHDRRALFVGGCSEEREDMILDTADVAQEILFEAYDHIYRMRTPTDRYKTWFGSYTPNRGRKVKDIIWWSKVTQLSSFRFNCTCDFTKVDPLSVAYVCMSVSNSRIIIQSLIAFFHQPPTFPETCGSALASGLTISITVLVYSSMSLPTSWVSATLGTKNMARMLASGWLGTTQIWPSRMPTTTSSSHWPGPAGPR